MFGFEIPVEVLESAVAACKKFNRPLTIQSDCLAVLSEPRDRVLPSGRTVQIQDYLWSAYESDGFIHFGEK